MCIRFLSKGGVKTDDATATANDILSPKTAYVNGEKITGTISNNGTLNFIPSDSAQVIPEGYTSGGIIEATDITALKEYDTCLSISNNILAGTPIYQKIEYIQNSSVSQYINTEVISTNKIEFEIKFNHLENKNMYETILGGQNSSGKGIFLMNTCNGSISQKSLRYNTTESKVSTTNTYFNEDVVVTLKGNVFTFTSNSGTESFSVGSTSEYDSGYPIWIFALNNGGSLFGGTKMKLYYLKIWEDGILIRDFIPVIDINNVVCLFDTINNKYYYPNKDTLIAGGEV